MNDYFLKILIKQRHAEIMAECKGIRHPQSEWPRTTFRLSHILRSILSIRKHTIVNHAQAVIETGQQNRPVGRMLLILSGAVDAKLSNNHFSIHILLHAFHRMRKQ
jgi:hypothetical protein